MVHLGYSKWSNFEKAVQKAMVSCETAKTAGKDHFAEIGKMVLLGRGSVRKVKDYKLTRYACYLIAQNGDPRKEDIAFAQSYFALQTRKQELIEERMIAIARIEARAALTEAEKQLSSNMYQRLVLIAKVLGASNQRAIQHYLADGHFCYEEKTWRTRV